jgi:hypothetical protein
MVELMASWFMSDRFPASAVPAVRTCGGFTATDDLKLCALARATRAATAGAHDEMVADARVFVAALPDDALATALLGRALPCGKAAEGGPLLDAALAKHPDDDRLLEARAVVALAGSWTDAAAWFERAAASPRAQLQVLNNAAWARLFYDPTPAGARALIDRAMLRGNDRRRTSSTPTPRCWSRAASPTWPGSSSSAASARARSTTPTASCSGASPRRTACATTRSARTGR